MCATTAIYPPPFFLPLMLTKGRGAGRCAHWHLERPHKARVQLRQQGTPVHQPCKGEATREEEMSGAEKQGTASCGRLCKRACRMGREGAGGQASTSPNRPGRLGEEPGPLLKVKYQKRDNGAPMTSCLASREKRLYHSESQ